MRVSKRASSHKIYASAVEQIDGGLNIDDDTERMREGGVEEERQMCTQSLQRDGVADGRRRRCVSGSRAGTKKRKRRSQRDVFLVLTTINGPASLRCSSIAAAAAPRNTQLRQRSQHRAAIRSLPQLRRAAGSEPECLWPSRLQQP